MTYVADTRTAKDVVAELARIARRTPVPPSLDPASWADLLFSGDALLDETEPSQTLLAALAALHGERGLLAHFDTLPASARRWFAQVRLGIQPLPTLADTVVLVVDADPKRTPVVLPKGAAVKAGKDDFGSERVYETQEALTVLGVPVVGAKTWHTPTSEVDRIVEAGPKLDPAPTPFAAFGTYGAGDRAVHRLYIASDLLALGTGAYTLYVTFTGISIQGVSSAAAASVVHKLFASLHWMLSGPKDTYVELGKPTVTGTAKTVLLEFSVATPSAPMDVGGESLYHLTAGLDDAGPNCPRKDAFGLSFEDVTLSLSAKEVLPDSGFFNDGVLDVSKEFKPFGPVPQVGDSFGLRSDTAFSKPLTVLMVSFDSRRGSSEMPVVSCQRFQDGSWQEFARKGFAKKLLTLTSFSITSPFSEPAPVGGTVGNVVRFLLVDEDFGWGSYQQTLASFANDFVTNPTKKTTLTKPPDPPRVDGVTIAYDTAQVSWQAGTVALYVVNGPSVPQSLKGKPFRHDLSGQPGVLYVGFGGAPAGETLSLYVEIDPQSVCDAGQAEADVTWSYRSTSAWAPLNVVDHTDDLRQSGIVRFAVPDDWQLGASELGEAAGYWIRASSAVPQLGGRIARLRTDAVEARYRLAADWAHDTTPATPLPPATAKQLKLAVPGIKKVDNPGESWGGRGPEPADAFARRTSRVLRHRNRAITPWDVETLVTESFPDVGLVRCLPHHSYDSECAPGWFSVVVVPRSLERLPRPSVQLAAQVETFLHQHATAGIELDGESHIAVLCPKYAEALVSATIVLQPGVQGGQARDQIAADLSEWLRPLGPNPDRSEFGRSFFLSSVVWWLESRSEVAYVKSCAFGGEFKGLDRIDTDGCRGLVASAAAHDLHVEPQL